MTKVQEVLANELIPKLAEELKKIEGIAPPEWASFVKTGAHKERVPEDADWWYIRTASILRKVRLLGPIGTEKLRTKYGGRKRRGHKPAIFAKGSGSIIRKALQQLENAGLITQTAKGVHKGRVVTGKGDKLLNSTAKNI